METDVYLASLPLSSAHYPSLALGLLKSAIAKLGIGCDVGYFSLDYLEEIGPDAFECLRDTEYHTALVGEWVFAGAAHDGEAAATGSDELRYLTDVFRAEYPEYCSASRLLTILNARLGATGFIERCIERVDWRRYAVVGVSTSFQQNMASLAFARRIKQRFPHILVVFGGANCQGEMGVELHRRYRFIDAVCLGEGDRVFPELVQRHLAGESAADLPGIVLRGPDGTTRIPAQTLDQVEDMDDLPYPDLTDFYEQHRATPAAAFYPPAVVFETSRGCWWGAKHHCTFCGLNGRSMAYRSKSQHRAYDELVHLTARHGHEVVNADAILDPRYFDEFLPRLAAEGPPVTMFWQMKANLRPNWLTLLSRAGVKRIQPGIEALDSELLALMNKGCTMLQNVQLLKLAAENGLSVAWNLLYGFPGENPEVYTRTSRLIPALRHLQPPGNTGRVLADRFSPYFQRPDSFGIRIEPAPAYNFIYPFDKASVQRLAYHFHIGSKALDRIENDVAPMKAEQRLWCEHHEESALYCRHSGEEVVVTDARWGWTQSTRTFSGAEAEVLRLCWRITPRYRIEAKLGNRFGSAALEAATNRLLDLGFLVREEEEFLALPLRQPGWCRAPTWNEILEARITPYSFTASSNP
jgi:ribosomal peptide maturation radical SAM protein 1